MLQKDLWSTYLFCNSKWQLVILANFGSVRLWNLNFLSQKLWHPMLFLHSMPAPRYTQVGSQKGCLLIRNKIGKTQLSLFIIIIISQTLISKGCVCTSICCPRCMHRMSVITHTDSHGQPLSLWQKMRLIKIPRSWVHFATKFLYLHIAKRPRLLSALSREHSPLEKVSLYGWPPIWLV